MNPIDYGLSCLVEEVRRRGDGRMVIYIGCDGRIDMYGEEPPTTRWIKHADVTVGGDLPLPSKALEPDSL